MLTRRVFRGRRSARGLSVLIAGLGVTLAACNRGPAPEPRQTAAGVDSTSLAPPRLPVDTARSAGFPADTPARPGRREPPLPTSPAPTGSTAAAATSPPRGRSPRREPGRAAPAPITGTASPNAAAVTPRVDTAVRTDTATAAAAPAAPPGPPPIPSRAFGIGEKLTYDVRFGPLRVGQASMEVLGIERLRGRDAYHTRFLLRGGTVFYRVNDRYESWFDARTLESLRYAQQIDQGTYERERLFEMYPERRTYTENGAPEQKPSVADPLDDGSFLYFLRTIPLEVGTTYEFNRYFRPDRNPVRVTVLRRERITVPAGTFDAIVVRPTIKTSGIFSEGGRAEVWFAADSTRRMLQMKSRLSFGSLNLYLKSVQ